MKDIILAKFAEVFGDAQEVQTYFAPGRVNLIGEHTDYNGGHVFPCALTIGTYGAARKRQDRKLRFFSMNFEKLGVIESSLDDLVPSKEAGWTNYPKGVMWAFGQRGMEIPCGMDLLLNGNIPNGSGLSSSASLEVLTGFILRDFFRYEVTNQDLALIGQFSDGEDSGFIVVNVTDPVQTKFDVVTLKFEDCSRVIVYQGGEEVKYAISGNTLELPLVAGEGMFVIPQY